MLIINSLCTTGLKMIEDVNLLLESAMVNPATGVHDPEVQEPPPLTPSTIAEFIKDPMLFDDNGDNGTCVCVCERERERESIECVVID